MDEDKKSKSKKDDTDFVIDEKGKLDEPKEEKVEKAPKAIKVGGGSRWKRFINWYKSNKKKSIPLTFVLILAILFAIPLTRYKAAALVVKNSFSIKLVDSTAGTAVSGAKVSLGGVSGSTDGSGKVTLKDVPVGSHELVISKKYYKDKGANVLVPILKQKTVAEFKLAATGRQVKISVKNLVNHNVLDNVDIKVGEVSAKTDKTGSATIVLPAGTKSAKAKLSVEGYNEAEVTVAVDDKTIKENNFALTPAGKIYFLSKLSGKIDIVKTNLDGSDRKTVLPGTGKEDNSGTVLLASRDWKYLALLSRREGGNSAKLYLFETSTDKLTPIEDGNSSLELVGWSEYNFVYKSSKNTINNWEPKKDSIRSYNAQNRQAITIEQNEAGGSDIAYAKEQIGSVYIFGNTVAYTKIWYRYGQLYYNEGATSGKSSGLYSVKTDGTSKKSLKTLDANSVSYINFQFSEPYEAYLTINKTDKTFIYAIYNGSGVSDTTADKVADEQYNTYLASPSGTQTFWSESRDGKNTLFIGDDKGENGKQIASLAEYKSYGWYTDDYLLVSKNSSELYIISKTGIDSKNQPVKITDYHKPAQNYFGYGGGYGGI